MEQAESKVEANPFEFMVSRFDIAAKKLGLDNGLYQVLLTPDREIGLAIPVQMANGKLTVFKGYRVQHNLARGPAHGGIRYAPDVTLDQILALGGRDDLEMCRNENPVRRSPGRDCLRSEKTFWHRVRKNYTSIYGVFDRHTGSRARRCRPRHHYR